MGKWEMVRLGDVCTINPPKKDILSLLEGKEVSFISMTDVHEDGKIDVTDIRKYSEVCNGFTYFKEDDVLFAKITPCMENGKGAIARGLVNGVGVGSTEFHVLRANLKYITSEWIFNFLAFPKIRHLAKKSMTGSAGQQRVPKAFLENIKIPLPPIDVQKHFTATLDKTQEIIDGHKKQLEELDRLIKATFYEMFGDPVVNSKAWDSKPCKELTTKIGSGATPTGGNESYKESGISLIRSLNVFNGFFKYDDLAYIDEEQADKLKNVIVESNDVLLNITGASVARSCIVPEDILPARVNQHVSIVRPNRAFINSIFLNCLFTDKYYQQKLLKLATGNGATREAITKQQIESLEIIVPPIELQNKFAQIVTNIEAQKALVKQSITESQNLFNSLMSEYFD